jgi:TPR repeat protein
MLKRRFLLLISLLLTCLVDPGGLAHAASVAAAKELIASGDVDGGREMLHAVAATGDAATHHEAGTELLNLGGLDGFQWIRSSAERGYASAQRDAGLMYHAGLGVEQNLPRALMWYTLALMGDLDPSLREDTKSNATKVYTAMTPQERKEAERLITNWKPK